MLYIGIGNAGCFLAMHVKEAIEESGNKLLSANAVYMLGDADKNNSTVFHLQQEQKIRSTTNLDGFIELPLQKYWNGGCGVYHAIGELLAESASNEVKNLIQRHAKDHRITFFYSVGGGTGGGVGAAFTRDFAKKSNVRAFVVTPEMESTSDTLIVGQDNFQVAAAGRFFVRLLATIKSQPVVKCDTFVISNSQLSRATCLFQNAVLRLDDYVARAQLMIPDSYTATYSRVVLFGMGFSTWEIPGQISKRDPAIIARRLVELSLQPLDLPDSGIPSGISALPTDYDNYRNWHSKIWEAGEAQNPTTTAFDAAQSVVAFLYRNDANACSDEELRQIESGVKEALQIVFKNSVVSVQSIDVAGSWLKDAKQQFGLMLTIENCVVEEIYRLVAYYLLSTFEWDVDGDLFRVSKAIDEFISSSTSLDSARDRFLKAVPLKPGPAGIEREVYVDSLWGNIEELKGKVLFALEMRESEFDDALVGKDEILSCLNYFRDLVQFRLRKSGKKDGSGGDEPLI